jgi:putative transposase
MTDVTNSGNQGAAGLPAADEQLLKELTERARADGLKLTGEDGLLGKLTKMVIEGALEGEMDGHLGYSRHDPAGRNSGNSRNGHRGKTVLTEAGPVEISVPRDRDSSFEPKIVAKRQRRLTGVEDMVISLSAKGLTHGEIAAHLAEVYGAEVSKQTITAITDRVMEGMAEWQNRPLDPVYAVVFIDAIQVKIREGQVANRPVYLALGVTADGERDFLGLWAGEHGDGEGAKFWLRVLAEIKNRGTRDVLMLVCDGLKGLPDAVNSVWEKAIVQTCIVHLLRNSFKYASKRDWAEVAKDLKPVQVSDTRLMPPAVAGFLIFACAARVMTPRCAGLARRSRRGEHLASASGPGDRWNGNLQDRLLSQGPGTPVPSQRCSGAGDGRSDHCSPGDDPRESFGARASTVMASHPDDPRSSGKPRDHRHFRQDK